jgi:Domain of unknown function (DUF5666)
MKTHMLKLAALIVFTAAFVVAPTPGLAQEKPKDPAATEKKAAPKEAKKKAATPARGKADAIDKIAKTVKVGERTFQVTSETKITKAGKPATLDDGKVGDEVGLSYNEVDGKLVARSLRFGPRPDEAATAKKDAAKKEKKAE